MNLTGFVKNLWIFGVQDFIMFSPRFPRYGILIQICVQSLQGYIVRVDSISQPNYVILQILRCPFLSSFLGLNLAYSVHSLKVCEERKRKK